MNNNPNNSTTASNAMAGVGAMAMMGSMVGSIKDQWNASGGNQVLDRVSANIPKETKEYLTKASSKFFSREKLRSIAVFFGIGEEKPFYIEFTLNLLIARLTHNMSFFYLNYFLITAVLFILTFLISPGAMIGIGLLAIAWFFLIRSTQNGYLTIKSFTISQKHATMVMSVISVIVLFRLLSSIFWWTLASSGFLTGMHAFLRDASMHKDDEDKVEMTGEVAGENASFLNSAMNSV